MAKNLYEVIGVDKTATQDEIKKAFREKAKKAHTDKEGGDHEEMIELNKAYAVLKIASKRAHYDQTGESEDTPFDKKFAGFIQQLFIDAIIKQKRDVTSIDLIAIFREYITDLITQHTAAKAGMMELIKRFEEVQTRLKSKKNNVIAITLQQNIDFEKQKASQTDGLISFFNEAILHLKDYDYSFEAPKFVKVKQSEFIHSTFTEAMMDDFRKQFERDFHDMGKRGFKPGGFGG